MKQEREERAHAGALSGVKVIDLSRVLGGPLAGQILADHGADVIKIEPPRGDETRDWGPPFKGDASSYFINVNRNKRALSLDLSAAQGRDILLALIEDADILIENFKPGTMQRWGLGYETLSQRFPRLIHASVTGFGAHGPFGGLPGYDLMAQAWSGLVSVNGSEQSGPLRLGVPLIDMATGNNAVIGILLALYERERSGQGQHIDLTLYDTGISLLHPQAPAYFMSGKRPELTGNNHPSISPYGMHRTRGASIFVTVGNERQFASLCAVLGRSDLAQDSRFATNALRIQNRDALTVELESVMCEHDGESLALTLMKAGVGAGAVQTVDQALAHPHTLHRDMVVQLDDYQGTGIPVKLSRTPGAVRTSPPHYGQHSKEILGEIGLSDMQIEGLENDGVVLTERKRHDG